MVIIWPSDIYLWIVLCPSWPARKNNWEPLASMSHTGLWLVTTSPWQQFMILSDLFVLTDPSQQANLAGSSVLFVKGIFCQAMDALSSWCIYPYPTESKWTHANEMNRFVQTTTLHWHHCQLIIIQTVHSKITITQLLHWYQHRINSIAPLKYSLLLPCSTYTATLLEYLHGYSGATS